MRSSPRAAAVIWLALVLFCSAWLARNLTISADLTVFLPPSTTPSQRLLISQLRDGVAGRLVLIALEGGDQDALARASRALADRLRASGHFGVVNNGDLANAGKEGGLLGAHRYLLSPAVSAERFTPAGLSAALQDSVALLASPAAPFIRRSLPQDPTGEARQVIELIMSDAGPARRNGVWFSRDGSKALLVAETLAPAFELDRQTQAIAAIRGAFVEPGATGARLLLSGTGVFGIDARATMQSEARWFSGLATVLVLGVLFVVYRSYPPVILSALPVGSGILAGIAAVGWTFGTVHGITLGFGATLIGEAVDYPSYAFIQAARGERLSDTVERIGPTLRLAVLTTVFGASAMALSSFQGLAQLGVLTIVGVGAAGLVTRCVLPALAPAGWNSRKTQALPFDAQAAVEGARRRSSLAVGLLIAALAVVAWKHDRLWEDDIANLSPIPEAAKTLDSRLRSELGAPDFRYLVVARGSGRESALEKIEAAEPLLQEAVRNGWIAGYDTPSRYLPAQVTQERRRASLPDAATLRRNLEIALRDSPFRDDLFGPFLEAVEKARGGPLLTAEDLRGSAFGLKVDGMMVRNADGWSALAPLRGVTDPARLAAASGAAGYELLDLKGESNALVNGYRNESLRLVAFGLLGIALLLAWGLRSIGRTARVLAPVLAALVVDVAVLLAAGFRLSLFNLVALLLVVGIGLNYALFFNRPAPDREERERTWLSLTVCCATTLSAFGCLAFSQTPVLRAIGVTVSLGTVLSLLMSATLSEKER